MDRSAGKSGLTYFGLNEFIRVVKSVGQIFVLIIQGIDQFLDSLQRQGLIFLQTGFDRHIVDVND